ncbi:TPA: hypothetical protein ACXNG6_000066 [Stenotrophomonas maltophilia]|nr:hypothetical protein [Stenotrophomonas maltophilia]
MNSPPSLSAPELGGSPLLSTQAYAPRPLARAESTRLDTYTYHSPRNDHRLVTVVEPCRLALALDLEFDPSVAAYVERPRTLLVRDRMIELCFWVSRKSGAESFIVFRRQAVASVPALRAEQQFCSELLEASQRAGLNLVIRKVQSILASRVANATRLELLPYVQAARRSRGVTVFVEAVMTHMRKNPVSSFHAIETSLRTTFDWRDIRSATCLLVHRGDLEINFNERLRTSSPVSLGAAQ